MTASKVFYSIFFNSPNMLYKAEHLSIQESLKKLIDKDINPYIEQWEKEKIFPAKHIFKLLGKGGFLGINKPVEYGGLGLDYSYHIAFVEQLGAIRCGSVTMGIGVQSSLTTPSLTRFGSDKLKREFLAPTIAGDMVTCLGVSEVEAGSDVAAIKTTARRDGDDLVINGGKMWITNGVQADWMCLLANTEVDKKSYSNKSLIVLPMKLPGVVIAKKLDKMGMHSSDTAQIFFEDVRVPASHIIGQPGQGFLYQMLGFQEERLYSVAAALLPLETLIKETMEYASNRQMYGRPLLNNQVVAFTLAELLSELECLRSLLHRAVYSYTYDNVDVTLLASISKLKVGRLSREITDKCLQFWGGSGYMQETFVNRMYRDFRLLSIGGGADEVMLDIISKQMVKAIRN